MFFRPLHYLKNRWHAPSGYREVLIVAVPMLLSTGAMSVQHFVDRMYLTWYSKEAVAAAAPAGMVKFTISCLFVGVATYAGTFVSQYHGAGRDREIGRVLWQGAYIGLLGGLLSLAMIPLAPGIFRLIGHEPVLQEYETIYFQMLCLGSVPYLICSALGGFYSGRGKTWVVMIISFMLTGVNILLDWLLIFGNWGFPKLGVMGAGMATSIAGWFCLACYLVLLLRRSQHEQYGTRRWRLDRPLLKRLMKFGLPSGVQFFLDVASFTVFMLLIGRLGVTELAATTITFQINSLAFMPMIGFGIAVSVEVGKYIGRGRPELAERSVWSALHMALVYIGVMAFLYLVIPELFIAPFTRYADQADVEQLTPMVVTLLQFVAVYSLFDAMAIIFSSAIKGAGDTRFVMIMILGLSLTALVIPSYLVLVVGDGGLYAGWLIIAIYIFILSAAFLIRFLSGKWKTMKVIEEPAPHVPPRLPDTPLTEAE